MTNMSGAGTCGQGPVPTLMSRSGGPTTNTLVRVDFLLLDHAALNWFGRTGPWTRDNPPKGFEPGVFPAAGSFPSGPSPGQEGADGFHMGRSGEQVDHRHAVES